MARLEIEKEGKSWAIKHDGGYLGFVRSRTEAEHLIQSLAAPSPKEKIPHAVERSRGHAPPDLFLG